MGIHREPDENIVQGEGPDGDPKDIRINPDGSVDASNVTDREIMIAMLLELQSIRNILSEMMNGECEECGGVDYDPDLNIRFN